MALAYQAIYAFGHKALFSAFQIVDLRCFNSLTR